MEGKHQLIDRNGDAGHVKSVVSVIRTTQSARDLIRAGILDGALVRCRHRHNIIRANAGDQNARSPNLSVIGVCCDRVVDRQRITAGRHAPRCRKNFFVDHPTCRSGRSKSVIGKQGIQACRNRIDRYRVRTSENSGKRCGTICRSE